jgi:DNA-binding Lrp family transcriptional regulator
MSHILGSAFVIGMLMVVEAYEIYGSIYDIIVKINATDDAKLKEIIRDDVRRIEMALIVIIYITCILS